MAMAADSTAGLHSGDLPTDSLPWNQGDQLSFSGAITVSSSTSSFLSAARAECSETEEKSEDGHNAADQPKKPAWDKPSGGAVEVVPVMGEASWPALTESAKPSSSKIVTEGSVPSSSSQLPMGPIIQNASPRQEASSSANPNVAPTPKIQARPRRGVAGGPIRRGFRQPPPPPPPPPPFNQIYPHPPPPPPFYQLYPPPPLPPFYQLYPPPVAFAGFGPPMRNTWEARQVGHYIPNSYSYGPHGNDRGNYGNAIDGPGGFVSPPNATAFGPPPPPRYRPYGNYPTEFPWYAPQLPLEVYGGIPIDANGLTFNPLAYAIVRQIDYYFSYENLVTDVYLRSHMDDQGWVPITLIAGFPRVKQLTNDIQLILESMKSSNMVEVKETKLRKRDNWMNWILNPDGSIID